MSKTVDETEQDEPVAALTREEPGTQSGYAYATGPGPSPEPAIERHLRHMLNELHEKCGYRTALIDELAAYVRGVLLEESKRPSY